MHNAYGVLQFMSNHASKPRFQDWFPRLIPALRAYFRPHVPSLSSWCLPFPLFFHFPPTTTGGSSYSSSFTPYIPNCDGSCLPHKCMALQCWPRISIRRLQCWSDLLAHRAWRKRFQPPIPNGDEGYVVAYSLIPSQSDGTRLFWIITTHSRATNHRWLWIGIISLRLRSILTIMNPSAILDAVCRIWR